MHPASARLTCALAALLSLSACRPDTAGGRDLVSRTLFTATGAYDAQADQRERIPAGQRRTTWTERPPLDAEQVVVIYDSDARPLSWMLEIRAPRFTAQALAGEGAGRVQTPSGAALRPAATSRLADALILPAKGGMRVLTRGYVTQNEPALLPAFQRR
ncbi:hypothetical protein GO986_08115 [Deinococcus sp. HMF7620]|uniref:Uncharacterized protein n=1 Tax=Deinococcus arboris TaxID=2682977 RepID=A0A7C9HRH3_9DEIO|nr:hypothetical protein [Deinococcus arboris]MVN86727.1 hypothetical protein [Deinococcus arboris]